MELYKATEIPQSFLPVTAEGYFIFNFLCIFQRIIIVHGIVHKFSICCSYLLSVLLINLSLDNCLKYYFKNTFKMIIISQCIFVLTDPICIDPYHTAAILSPRRTKSFGFFLAKLSLNKMSTVIDWFLVTYLWSNSNVSRPGYNCVVVASTPSLFVCFCYMKV